LPRKNKIQVLLLNDFISWSFFTCLLMRYPMAGRFYEWWIGKALEGSGHCLFKHLTRRKANENLAQFSWSPDRELSPGLSEYEAGVSHFTVTPGAVVACT